MSRRARTVSHLAIQIADTIDREIAARLGPNSTFAEREAAAAAMEAEIMVEFARREAAMKSPKDEG
jgi:hypothetical protein